VPPKLVFQTYDTGANFGSVDSSLKKISWFPAQKRSISELGAHLGIGLNSEVHLRAKDNYILSINLEAVVNESFYSDTVYALRKYYL